MPKTDIEKRKEDAQESKSKEEEEVEVEEDLPWIQEKALDLVEFTGSVTQAIPGPRVGQSSLPWILAIPLAYVGISFVIAFVKTVKKFSSPRERRRKLVLLMLPLLGFSIRYFVCLLCSLSICARLILLFGLTTATAKWGEM